MNVNDEKWVKCSKCKSLFLYEYLKGNSCPVCGKPIQDYEICEEKSV